MRNSYYNRFKDILSDFSDDHLDELNGIRRANSTLADELQSDIAERDEKISSCLAKEKELRSQIREARKNQGTVDAMPGDSATHQKRESDLRRQLKDARREIEQLQARAEQEDAEVQRSFIEAGNIRSQLRKQVKASETDLAKIKREPCEICDIDLEMCHEAAIGYQSSTSNLYLAVVASQLVAACCHQRD